MKERVYQFLKLLLCFLLFFYIGDLSGLILSLFGINIDDISNLGMVIYQFIVSLIMFLVLCIAYFKTIKEDLF